MTGGMYRLVSLNSMGLDFKISFGYLIFAVTELNNDRHWQHWKAWGTFYE